MEDLDLVADYIQEDPTSILSKEDIFRIGRIYGLSEEESIVLAKSMSRARHDVDPDEILP